MLGIFKKQGTFKVSRARSRKDNVSLVSVPLNFGNEGLRLAVKLPVGEDKNEWLAINTYDFYNQIFMMYTVFSEHCTSESCPTMSAGPKYEYTWMEGKSPTMVCAPDYIRGTMSKIRDLLDNRKCFPVDDADKFPSKFGQIVSQIFKKYFRVFAHIFHHHYDVFLSVELEGCISTSFRHFVLFSDEFGLLKKED